MLKVGVIGRTEMLLEAARGIARRGHVIGFVATCQASGHEMVAEDAFARFASEHGVQLLRGRELTSDLGLSVIRAAACDIAISMNWLHVIPNSVLKLFPVGIFNAHPGNLPQYRGNAAPNWAILRGEPEVYLTIHQMSETLDAGPIAFKRKFSLEPRRNIADVYEWLRGQVPAAFVDLVNSVEAGSHSLASQPNDPSLALRCYPRRPSDGRVDWTCGVEKIDRLVRASGRPFAGSYTTLEGIEIMRIWSASPIDANEPFLAIPGQVAFAVDGDPVIAASDGYIRLRDVTFDGTQDSDRAKAAILKSLRNRLI